MIKIIEADVVAGLGQIAPGIVQTVVTSPPYWGLRDYGSAGQIGNEKTPDEFVARLVEVFREVRRVLRDDGTLWLNMGDSYNGLKVGSTQKNVGARRHNTDTFRKEKWGALPSKNLIGIPWRLAFALQEDGWILRQDIIWAKPGAMPESVTDRCTKSHEYIFLFAKKEKYFFDAEAIKEPISEAMKKDGRTERGTRGKAGIYSAKDGNCGFNPTGRNRRDVWTISPEPSPAEHFAAFPQIIPAICISAGSKPGDVVLDPFAGSGTSLLVAKRLQRDAIGIEISPEYCSMIRDRLALGDDFGRALRIGKKSNQPTKRKDQK